MTVDYDLVIVGGSPVGRYAAQFATQLGARVALVEPDKSPGLPALGTWLAHHALLQQLRDSSPEIIFPESVDAESEGEASLLGGWHEQIAASLAIAHQWESERSLPMLATMGIDVVLGQAEFSKTPTLALHVDDRRLRSRFYLLAMSGTPTLPAINGLDQVPIWTLQSLWQDRTALPSSLFILGDRPPGIELAQALARLGIQVTLILEDALGTDLDEELAYLLQTQLEADGITVLPQSSVSQVRYLDDRLWIQIDTQAWQADGLLLATANRADGRSLQLDTLGIPWEAGITVGANQRTRHPKIYACGATTTRQSVGHLAQQEAQIAVRNALFFPVHSRCDRLYPRLIATDPPVVSVGLTEAAARQQSQKRVILRQWLKFLPQAAIAQTTTGLCKLVLSPGGTLLGAHLMGPQAPELIPALTLAIQQKVSMAAIAQLSIPSPTWAEVLREASEQWQVQQRQQSWISNLQRAWCTWRRDRVQN